MPAQKNKNKNSVNDLILFVLYSLVSSETAEKKMPFGKIAKECFKKFPQVFSLHGYSQWPDTRKLDRPLRSLRKKKLVFGKPDSFFSLTAQGKKEAQLIARIFRQKKLFK